MTTTPTRKKQRSRKKTAAVPRVHDPLLVRVRAARAGREKAEYEYGDAVIAALEKGNSYQAVADAALTDKGTLHYWVQRYIKRRGVKVGKLGGTKQTPPAQV